MKGVLFSSVPQLSIQLVSFLLHDSLWMYEVNGQGLWKSIAPGSLQHARCGFKAEEVAWELGLVSSDP